VDNLEHVDHSTNTGGSESPMDEPDHVETLTVCDKDMQTSGDYDRETSGSSAQKEHMVVEEEKLGSYRTQDISVGHSREASSPLLPESNEPGMKHNK